MDSHLEMTVINLSLIRLDAEEKPQIIIKTSP